ncbi:DegT/DnrJ/EryC1/StrS family aminotransferase [Geotalea toluenoxydans]|uniref:DegT/DnrJ/EryC1/StrS family aminotransferase n=1 Tax=Geotalea toluenoxydans TaxID=421624 RepID=UPI000ADB1A56|nr:DegT/DnrJ/EryC1/StrS family aminotransferase [Geotalea toluenoxydans]
MEEGKKEEKVLREQVIQAAIKYYEFKHKGSQRFFPGNRIPYAGRVFDEKEIANLVDSSLDFWLTTGRYAERFEREFAEFLGIQHCSLTNSGSSANLLALMALTRQSSGKEC